MRNEKLGKTLIQIRNIIDYFNDEDHYELIGSLEMAEAELLTKLTADDLHQYLLWLAKRYNN